MHAKKNLHLFVFILLVIFSLFLVSCGEDEETPVAEEPAVEQPVAEQPTAEAQQPTAPQEGAVDTGFRPEVDGFSYQNYGDVGQTPTGETFDVINLTSVEMRRMFGDVVCAAKPKKDGSCKLTPPAEQWMEQNNSGMNGGHCEGFAVLSQLIHDGQVDPNQFGASKTFDLQIAGNEPLQRELAYWWATQGPLFGQNQRLAPVDAVAYLQKEYSANPKNMISIGIYKEDGTGGHAISAYGVQDKGDGVYWILVYDNNYPGEERHMTLDTNANTWEYEASINPSVEPDLYKGGVENPIEFTPDQERLTIFPCDFCGANGNASKGGSGLAAAAPKYNEIWTEGYVNVALEDDKGRSIGYDEKGKLVNEIPEAKLQLVRAGTLSEVPPVIDMPTGLGFTAYIYGDKKAADEPASVVMIGEGFYIGVDNIVMAPEQLDQLAFDGEGDFITYTTDAQESPDIIVGIEKPKADFELDLKAVEISKGTDIHVLFDQKEDVFAFQTTSDAVAKFNISITRIDENGEEETFDTGDTPIEVEPGKLMYFYFGKWEGQGSNLEVGYDENGNGTIEDSEISNMADAQ
jgi:hypothetical protein